MIQQVKQKPKRLPWELRAGKWQDALADVPSVDVLIADPPFSERVHEGQRTGGSTRRSTIQYDAIDEASTHEFVDAWTDRVRYWALIFSDHTGSRFWEHAFETAGWYVFAPVLWIRTNPTPRIAGDGPTSAADYIVVARPRAKLPRNRTGSRPGYYLTVNEPGSVLVPGGKQLGPMRTLIRDYTLRGDLVCDPFAGGGTTLRACQFEGRRSIGSERDPATLALATARLSEPYTGSLFSDDDDELAVPPARAEQIKFDLR